VKRREFLLLLSGAVTVPSALSAQQKSVPAVGYLGGASPDAFAPFLAAFRQGLKETGFVEGQDVAIEYRWAEGQYDRLPSLAADLVGPKVDVIATSGGTVLLSRQKLRLRRSRSSSLSVRTRSRPASLPVSPGRLAT